MAHGLLFDAPARTSRFFVDASSEVVIGRAPPRCGPPDVRIDDETLAPAHARIVPTRDGFIVESLAGSPWLDGRRVDARAPLRAGMRLALGPAGLGFEIAAIQLRERSWEEALAWPRWSRLAKDYLTELAHLHSCGRVHGYLRPSELLERAGGGGVMLLRGWQLEVGADVLRGNPTYDAPETMDLERPLEPASDVYSLGLVLFELACASRPFPDSNVAEQLWAKLRGELAWPASLPDELRAWFERVLAPDPERRPSARAALDSMPRR